MRHTGSWIIGIFLVLSFSCTRPRYFTNYYTGEYTGLDTLINIQGIYVFERNDSSNTKYYIMFNNDGMLIDTYTSSFNDTTRSYFEGDRKYAPMCGTYYLDKDTLKAQTILDYGWLYGIYVIFKDFHISSDGKLSFLREYMLEDRKKRSINKWNFKPNTFLNPGTFIPLDKKDHRCEYIKKKWFTGKK